MHPESSRYASWAVLVVVCVVVLAAALPSASAEGATDTAMRLTAGVLLVVAAGFAAFALSRSVGSAAPLMVAILILASRYGHALQKEPRLVLLSASTALALALIFIDRRPGEVVVRDVYDPSDGAASLWTPLRWGVAGVGLGLSATTFPIHLALALAAIAVLPFRRTGLVRALVPYLGGVVTGIGVGAVLFGAVTGDATPSLDGMVAAGVEEAFSGASLDGALLRRNLLLLFLGSTVGFLVAFPGVVLPLFGLEASRARMALLAALAVILLAPLALWPFDFWFGEGAGAHLPRSFLVVFPAFWFLAGNHIRVSLVLASGILALVVASPQLPGDWVAPRLPDTARVLELRYAERGRTFLESRLPAPTSQRFALADEGQLTPAGLFIWTRAGATAGARGVFEVEADEPATVLVAAPRALDRLVARVGGDNVPSSLGLEGAEVRELMLEADGDVRFEIGFDRPEAVHAVWWARGDWFFYRLRLLLPGASPEGRERFEVELVDEELRPQAL